MAKRIATNYATSSNVPLTGDRAEGNEMKLRVFERLSRSGVLKSMQQSLRKAIDDELELIHSQRKQQIRPRDTVHQAASQPENGNDILSELSDVELNGDETFDKISTIALWEKKMRLELEIEREIQTKELERQRVKLDNEWRKLHEKDKVLRIELDAKERRVRRREDDIKNELDEVDQKLGELHRREEIINEIVAQKVKGEVCQEREKLRSKFYELEQSRENMAKREEKIREIEARLHEQAKIVKEKIEAKKDYEIELAKLRREYEITKLENEALKSRFQGMQDYQVVKFEKNSLKTELNAIKNSLKSKQQELDSSQDRWEREAKGLGDRVLKLKLDLKKQEEELLLTKQKHQGENNEWSERQEQLTAEVQQLRSVAQQLALKNQLLSKEVLALQKELSKTARFRGDRNTNFTQTEEVGCHLCEANANAVRGESLEFLASARDCLGDLKRAELETLINERNKLSLQMLGAAPQMPITTVPSSTGGDHSNYSAAANLHSTQANGDVPSTSSALKTPIMSVTEAKLLLAANSHSSAKNKSLEGANGRATFADNNNVPPTKKENGGPEVNNLFKNSDFTFTIASKRNTDELDDVKNSLSNDFSFDISHGDSIDGSGDPLDW